VIRTDRANQLRRLPPLNDPRALCAALDLGTDSHDRQRQAAGLTVRCPRHGGVSCSVTRGPDGTVRVRCFGCEWTGDALDLVAVARGVDRHRDFRHVLAEAASLTGRDLGESNETSSKRPDGMSDEDYHAIWTFTLETLSPLTEHAWHVAKYLHARAVFEEAEAVDVRGLPRDPRPLVASLLATFDRTKLEAVGVLRADLDVLDWAAWALCIPWRDRFGRITCVQRRRLDDGRPKYRFPRGRAPRAPFGVDLLADALNFQGPDAEVIFVEGALDCLARRRIARERGERATVLGVASASDPCAGLPVDLLANRTILLALDNDQAGEQACAKIAHALRDIVRRFVRARPVGAKDWGEALAGVVR
jgi:DNA primase